MFNICGYKLYSPTLISLMILFGMIIILIVENCGLSNRENNLSLRISNNFQIPSKKIKHKPMDFSLVKSNSFASSSLKIIKRKTKSQIKKETIDNIENILIESINNEVSY